MKSYTAEQQSNIDTHFTICCPNNPPIQGFITSLWCDHAPSYARIIQNSHKGTPKASTCPNYVDC